MTEKEERPEDGEQTDEREKERRQEERREENLCESRRSSTKPSLLPSIPSGSEFAYIASRRADKKRGKNMRVQSADRSVGTVNILIGRAARERVLSKLTIFL